MMLDISADDLRRDLITYRTSKIAIFPKFPAPEATLHSWELTKMARALKLLNRVTTCAIEYRGGKEQKIWTWSGLTSISSMVMSYCSAISAKSSRTRCCISPCKTSRRYLGDQTKYIAYRRRHGVCVRSHPPLYTHNLPLTGALTPLPKALHSPPPQAAGQPERFSLFTILERFTETSHTEESHYAGIGASSQQYSARIAVTLIFKKIMA